MDTNILVYAYRNQSPFHSRARAIVMELANGSNAWAIPWPCIHELLAVLTNPRIYKPVMPPNIALTEVGQLLQSPSVTLLAETDQHWIHLRQLVERGIAGSDIHDAEIAAVCLQHGVRELWTADRDFSRFPGLKVVNPLRN